MDIQYTNSFSNVRRLRNGWLFLQKQWFTLVLIYLGLHLLLNKNISIQVGMDGVGAFQTTQTMGTSEAAVAPTNVSLMGIGSIKDNNAGFSISNLTPILSPDYGERHGIPQSVIHAKIKVCKNYIKKYAPIARKEREEFGIPMSITLAQGLLESNAGESRLASESNNHFGIKCKTKCRGCTCRNYTDDDVFDMFRVFPSVLESYREHSLLLNSPRYQHLLQLDHKNYKAWAHGLKQAGYATDKRYAHKLIQIIEALKLYRYDR